MVHVITHGGCIQVTCNPLYCMHAEAVRSASGTYMHSEGSAPNNRLCSTASTTLIREIQKFLALEPEVRADNKTTTEKHHPQSPKLMYVCVHMHVCVCVWVRVTG